ncbi:DUF6526 family protein [Mucilaginibacter ginsenosidivorans]|uniref:Uncharacterized protein n=1 Tax=Mucilaginibacter ginsenosidivorans TaxID=398053 RepID=A0A5B8UWV3_9SPHI|nr:DUF6526 family protein [Mucilaginibacter ginsenosidivorans]QEC63600.1 hypothetical protein FRZ54_13775 [Mucilaginibacter ginsenosidivorans]
MKKTQTYATHKRIVPGFHFLASSLLFLGAIAAIVNIFRHPPYTGGFVSAVLLEVMFIAGLLLFWYARQFALRAQDRAIRAEENLRHYVLTGKLLDARLSMAQTIALRFAPDEEFPELAGKAAVENMSSEEIKKAVVQWRADHHRA